jgi:hypothetical protein
LKSPPEHQARRQTTDEACDAEFWTHVYGKDRLRVVQACTPVEGKVVGWRHESDGDFHIALDPKKTSVLNLINATQARDA